MSSRKHVVEAVAVAAPAEKARMCAAVDQKPPMRQMATEKVNRVCGTDGPVYDVVPAKRALADATLALLTQQKENQEPQVYQLPLTLSSSRHPSASSQSSDSQALKAKTFRPAQRCDTTVTMTSPFAGSTDLNCYTPSGPPHRYEGVQTWRKEDITSDDAVIGRARSKTGPITSREGKAHVLTYVKSVSNPLDRGAATTPLSSSCHSSVSPSSSFGVLPQNTYGLASVPAMDFVSPAVNLEALGRPTESAPPPYPSIDVEPSAQILRNDSQVSNQMREKYAMKHLNDLSGQTLSRGSSVDSAGATTASASTQLTTVLLHSPLPPTIPEGFDDCRDYDDLENEERGEEGRGEGRQNIPSAGVAISPSAGFIHHRSPSISRAGMSKNTVSQQYVSSEQLPSTFFRAGKWWEKLLVAIIFLSSLLMVTIAVTNPFLKWFPTGRQFVRAHYNQLGLVWQSILWVHICTCSVMLLFLPVLITPYIFFSSHKLGNPSMANRGNLYDISFRIYIIFAIPAVLTSYPLGAYPEPFDFATVSAFMAGSCLWTISLPFMIYYKTIAPDTERLFLWLTRQIGLTFGYPFFRNFILHPILFKCLPASITYKEFYGGSIWLSVFVAVASMEYIVLPWYLKRYFSSQDCLSSPVQRPRQSTILSKSSPQWAIPRHMIEN